MQAWETLTGPSPQGENSRRVSEKELQRHNHANDDGPIPGGELIWQALQRDLEYVHRVGDYLAYVLDTGKEVMAPYQGGSSGQPEGIGAQRQRVYCGRIRFKVKL